jgi:maleylacetoacetate isomerase
MSTDGVTLYSYWRSSCSWRVRMQLAYKNIPTTIIPVNLLKGEHKTSEYMTTKSPNAVVPALIHQQHTITQSMAMMEYIEEVFQGPATLPKDPVAKAHVRALCLLIIADTQPIQNLKVLNEVERIASKEAKEEWARKWISDGLQAFERKLKQQELEGTLGDYCYGNSITMADFCLFAQLYNARRFGIKVEELIPLCCAVEKRCENMEWFQVAHPNAQIDNPEKK